MSLRFIHAVDVSIACSFLLLTCMNIPQYFTYLPVDGHIDYFQFGAITNQAAINIQVADCIL